MKRVLPLPFALLLAILPITGTVAMRLLLLFACGGIALWQWLRVSETRTTIPCKATLLLWAAVCAASLAYAVDPAYTALELKNEVGFSMLAFLAFFAAAADRAAAIGFLRTLAAAFALLGVWALLGWSANGMFWDDTGRYGGLGTFSTYIVTVLPVLTWLAWNDPRHIIRRSIVGLLLFAVFLAIISMQRAAWPAFAVQALLLLACRLSDPGFGRRRAAAITAGIVLVTVAGLQLVQHQRLSHGVSALSGDVRAQYWPKAIAMVAAHPFAGAGFGRQAIQKAYPELTPPECPDLWHAHNVILNYGLELGVPGVVALLAVFAAFARLFWRTARRNGGDAWAGIAGLAIVGGVLTRNQFNDFFVRDMSLLFWALLGIFARLAARSPGERSADTAP